MQTRFRIKVCTEMSKIFQDVQKKLPPSFGSIKSWKRIGAWPRAVTQAGGFTMAAPIFVCSGELGWPGRTTRRTINAQLFQIWNDRA